MYRCRNCKSEFEEFNTVHTTEIETGCGYDDYYCPNCGSESFYELTPCTHCGEEFSSSELEYGFCKTCKNITLNSFKDFWELFDKNKKKFLDNFFNGTSLYEVEEIEDGTEV